MDLPEVGARLKAVRETLKLSMDQMRDITGYSKSLISAAENGLKKPSTIYLFAMYHKFNVNIHYIFSGKGSMFLDTAGQPPPPAKDEEKQDQSGAVPFVETEHIRELLYLMENVDMVRYAVLGYFIQYKSRNKHLIEEQLEEKKKV